ncbi:LysR family transcriptional regulator [Cupriavidus taiwanensis]|uniref:Transcriptional regulator, LysR family n=1 Tax=Cupriavidus taiwanensis TaxID=164546 RepID=A0A9Q7XTD3_9BURK|nr:LysR family transcriptional regulator [Cupriavidus taiwanensis]SOY70830.1 Transcriptional regulator, LysR family [Cupriavidus taiwanensis]SPD66590.1 Transcriptional regulator, LysR family [Cupriavidus taiwanensis]
MELSFDNVAVFVAAAREKSFSATARRLGRAQSAISTAIGDLEVDLGVVLFDRSGRYPVLTPAGEALLDEAEAILSRCESLKERAGALSGVAQTQLALAVEDAVPLAMLAPVLARLPARYPGVRLNLLQPCTKGVLEMVLDGEAEFGLGCTRPNYPAHIGFCRLGHVTLMNVAHRDHPLARMEGIRFAQLADHLQLLLPAQVAHLQTSEYLKCPKRWHLQSQVALIDLLRQGIGWSMVPRRLIAAELASGELVELRLAAYPFTEWTAGLDLLWNAEANTGVVGAWLKAEIMRTRIVV